MFEHPYLSQQVTRFEQEQLERTAEQRRFLIEHADQIVPRPEGPIRRMLRIVLHRGTDAASWTAETVSMPNGRSVRARTANSRAANARGAKARAAAESAAMGCAPSEASAR